jgi:hypothetical protein
MEEIASFWNQYDCAIFQFIIAVLYLIGFYIAARIVKSIIHRVLLHSDVDNKFTKTVGLKENFPIEKVVSTTTFWIIMGFGFLTFFEKLDLTSMSQPLNTLLTEIFAFLPKLGAALGLLLLAWILAAIVKRQSKKHPHLPRLMSV